MLLLIAQLCQVTRSPLPALLVRLLSGLDGALCLWCGPEVQPLPSWASLVVMLGLVFAPPAGPLVSWIPRVSVGRSECETAAAV